MISADQTTLQTGRFTGILLLLVVSILPLAATVRAEDKSDKKTGTTQQDAEKLERLLDDTRAMLRAQHLRALSEIRNSQYRQALELLTQQELKTSTQELKNLGFDDKLTDSLIKDHAKARSATQIIENILKLTDKDRVDTRTGNTGTLRIPRHPMAPEEQAKLLQYFKEVRPVEDATTDNDQPGQKRTKR